MSGPFDLAVNVGNVRNFLKPSLHPTGYFVATTKILNWSHSEAGLQNEFSPDCRQSRGHRVVQVIHAGKFRWVGSASKAFKKVVGAAAYESYVTESVGVKERGVDTELINLCAVVKEASHVRHMLTKVGPGFIHKRTKRIFPNKVA